MKTAYLLCTLVLTLSTWAYATDIQKYNIRCNRDKDASLYYFTFVDKDSLITKAEGLYTLDESGDKPVGKVEKLEARFITDIDDMRVLKYVQSESNDSNYIPRKFKNHIRFNLKQEDNDRYFRLIIPSEKKVIEKTITDGAYSFKAIADVGRSDQGGEYIRLNCKAWKLPVDNDQNKIYIPDVRNCLNKLSGDGEDTMAHKYYLTYTSTPAVNPMQIAAFRLAEVMKDNKCEISWITRDKERWDADHNILCVDISATTICHINTRHGMFIVTEDNVDSNTGYVIFNRLD